MSSTEHSGTDVASSSGDRRLSPSGGDWFWRPWYAKALWILAAIYWVGLYSLLLVPADRLSNPLVGGMILLIFVFNPVTVIAILGHGFLKAKVACGDWITVPGMSPEHSEWLRREREAAYINPADALSGYMHQQYLDKSKRHSTGPAGP